MGHITESEICILWIKISISYNCCLYSFVIASVGFNIITQHTPKFVENCSDNIVLYNCLSNLYQTLYKFGCNSKKKYWDPDFPK